MRDFLIRFLLLLWKELKIGDYIVPQVIELTFYRKDCNLGVKRKSIPHPEDIINDLRKPVQLLGTPWI